jgi:uncharacterized protein
LEFARDKGSLVGTVDLDDLSRLSNSLSVTDGSLDVELVGSRDSEHRAWLGLKVSGEMELICQRCLAGVPLTVRIASRLQLISPGQVWPDEDLADDGTEAIDADDALAVAQLVEDEVLLALPIAPMHEGCGSPDAAGKEHGPSPFAALAALRKH